MKHNDLAAVHTVPALEGTFRNCFGIGSPLGRRSARIRGMRIVVRRIEPHDASRLKKVRLAALADAPAAFGSTYAREAAFSDAEWAERSRRGSSGSLRTTFFVQAEGEVVGLVGGYRDAAGDPVVELVSMWVDPSHRRRGVGQVLVEAVCDWARHTGADMVALWVTRGNAPAEVLYRRLGFVETGEVQPLLSDPLKDELRLQRLLALQQRGE